MSVDPKDFVSKRVRLTQLEKRMLMRAAEFALSGEWPWGEENMAREFVALQRAADKLKREAE